MKKLTRAFALLLAVLMLACTAVGMVSCGDNDTPATTTKNPGSSTTTPGSRHWINDYDPSVNAGKTLRIAINDYAMTKSAEPSTAYIKGADDTGSDALMSFVNERNENVAVSLGLDPDTGVTYTLHEDQADKAVEWLRTNISTQNAYDIVIDEEHGLVRAMLNGWLANAIDSTDGTSYINLDADGWMKDYTLGMTLNHGQVYMLGGDYTMDLIRYAFVMYMNSTYYKEDMNQNLEDFYGVINDFDWDWNYFINIVQTAQTSTTGSLTTEDVWSFLSGSMIYRAAIYSSGVDVFDFDENGTPSYVNDPTILHSFVSKVIELQEQKGVSFNAADVFTRFTNGKALFYAGCYLCELESQPIQDMQKYNVLVIPYPVFKADEDTVVTHYNTLISDNAKVAAIPYMSNQFSLATAYIQLSMEDSADIMDYYYDRYLKGTTSKDEGNAAIIDKIKDGILSPTVFLFDNYVARTYHKDEKAAVYDFLKVCCTNGTNDFSNQWASYTPALSGSSEASVKRYELSKLIEDFLKIPQSQH